MRQRTAALTWVMHLIGYHGWCVPIYEETPCVSQVLDFIRQPSVTSDKGDYVKQPPPREVVE